jgi:hypothetical protein
MAQMSYEEWVEPVDTMETLPSEDDLISTDITECLLGNVPIIRQYNEQGKSISKSVSTINPVPFPEVGTKDWVENSAKALDRSRRIVRRALEDPRLAMEGIDVKNDTSWMSEKTWGDVLIRSVCTDVGDEITVVERVYYGGIEVDRELKNDGVPVITEYSLDVWWPQSMAHEAHPRPELETNSLVSELEAMLRDPDDSSAS